MGMAEREKVEIIFNFQQAFKRKLVLMKSVRLSQYACWFNNNHNDLSIEGDELNVFPILLPDGSRGGVGV